MNIIDKIINVLTRPFEFFKDLKKEKGIKDAFVYLALLSLIMVVLGTVLGLFMQSFSTDLFSRLIGITLPQQEISIGWVTFVAIMSYGLNLGLSFVWAGILHVWILIFGGKADYTKTYQLMVYAKTPKMLFGWFPFISSVIWIYDLILLIIGTEKVHDISRLRSILMYVIPVAVYILMIILIIILVIVVLSANPDILNMIAASA